MRKRASARAMRQKRVATRARRAFVASTDLRPMADQLLGVRSPAAYSAVERYARKHSGTESGALAWIVLGYARSLDGNHLAALGAYKRTGANAGILADYVAYLTAVSQDALQQYPKSVETLRAFGSKYPDSVLLRDAALLRANALLETRQPKEAVNVLETVRLPARSDIELMLGKAYAMAGEPSKATDALRVVYYGMPLSAQATDAKAELGKLTASPVDFARKRSRAELLIEGRRWKEANAEFGQLAEEAADAEKSQLRVYQQYALFRSGNNDARVRSALESIGSVQGDAEAVRLYVLTEIARNDRDEGKLAQYLDQLRAAAPASTWMSDALLTAGNMYMLQRNYDPAARFYLEIPARNSEAKQAAFGHWRGAWYTYKQGKIAEAKQLFEDQIAKFPESAEVAGAIYWRGRLAEENGDPGLARAYYNKLVTRFGFYYYAELARERMGQMKYVAPKQVAILDAIPDEQKISHEELKPPADNAGYQKSRLLANAALYDFALRELQATGRGALWAAKAEIDLHEQRGMHHQALRAAKRSVPSYFTQPFIGLPRDVWEALFPRPYWNDLRKNAEAKGLDPLLVASLIRQESEFNPEAVSHANAIGLMQLLPDVGRKVARQEKVRRFSTSQLTLPGVNLQLGTRYFKDLLAELDSVVPYALAAYNAGPDRVADWRANGQYKDIYDFIESIPFSETRGYVQSILRGRSMYQRLYGKGDTELALTN